jgi:phosphoglycolate phosphatase
MLIVFDLDGTLVDSQRDLADATNALLAEHGKAPLSVERVSAMVGEGAAVLVRRALTAAGLDPEFPGALDRFLVHYGERLTVHTRPYDGMPAVLSTLRASGHTLGVLTNKPGGATSAILDRLQLASCFSDVIGGDGPAGRKPDPAGLRGMIARAGGVASSTVLVGDSPVDLATARNAGARICLARYGFGFRFDPSAFRGDELFVDRPSEILDVLEPAN